MININSKNINISYTSIYKYIENQQKYIINIHYTEQIIFYNKKNKILKYSKMKKLRKMGLYCDKICLIIIYKNEQNKI